MKCIIIVIYVFLSIAISSSNLFAQYDAGTVAYSQTSTANLTSVLNNYKVVDFDGDNYSDVVMIKDATATNTSQLTWYKGDGNGNFSIQINILNIQYDHRKNEIFYADMNEDGINDIVFQNSDTGFTTLFNNGQGNISAQITNEVATQQFVDADLKELADVDGDGDMDGIFFAKEESYSWGVNFGYCLIGYNDGNGNFNNYNNIDNAIPEIFVLVETGDIDGDGDLDIICSGNKDFGQAGTGGESPLIYTNPFVRVYKNLGTNGFTPQQEIVTPTIVNEKSLFNHIKIQDINSDGTDELMIEYAILDNCIDDLHFHNCAYFYQFHVLDYNIQNEEFTALETYNSWLHCYEMQEYFSTSKDFYDDAFLVQFGNQNTDNNLDILSINVPQGKLHWYYGDGNGGFNNGQVVNFNSQYSSIRPALRVADIDNDTDLDIFVLLNDDTSSKLTVFKNLALSPTCSSVLDLAATPLTNGIYQAGATLISSGNVAIGSNVTLKAGNRVSLESGFRIPQNSLVKVRIDSCN